MPVKTGYSDGLLGGTPAHLPGPMRPGNSAARLIRDSRVRGLAKRHEFMAETPNFVPVMRRYSSRKDPTLFGKGGLRSQYAT